ncbi:hypothetical protein L596_005459 [Steinernema carpocapsae]|uniref:DUF4794 domain-containing protein n=1 Tax=Steinernema carpocapsae TaxID=34508 RepID=A0A4U8V0N4_STECR|nr:hypothetical protein L596_005459 [Steinernema carpocapsae]
MSSRWILVLALCAVASAGISKRSNGYGDEAVTPAPAAQSYDAPAPPEQVAPRVSQPAPEQVPVQSSGYRKKRNNGYGDEVVAPPAPAYGEQSGYGAPAPVEQVSSPVVQPPPANPAPVQASGYRKKRNTQNGYGDEAVNPAAPAVQRASEWQLRSPRPPLPPPPCRPPATVRSAERRTATETRP